MGGYTVCPIISKASYPFSACHLPLGFHSAFGIVPLLRLPIRFRRHVRRKRNHSAGMGSLRVLPPGGSNAIGKTRKTQKSPLKDFFDNDKAAHPPLDNTLHGRFSVRWLLPGSPAAHPLVCLMLLPSGPDMVHSGWLHGTRVSILLNRGCPTKAYLKTGIRPCCSGLQVQGTADSPLSAARIF